jgi:glutathione S-transferase
MVLKLYGHPNSTCGLRVAVVLHEKKVPFEFVSIDVLKGEHKQPAYLAKQPFGQVPVLEDDGLILFESRAMGRYVASKWADQGTPLVPSPTAGPVAWAKLDQAASIESFNFEANVLHALVEGYFKTLRGGTPDKEEVKSWMDKLAPKLDVYEKILSKQKYIAGDELTIVDLYHLPHGSLLPKLGLDTLDNPARPNVARWWKSILERPSWQAVKDGIVSVQKYD